jgi:hypothetical protein
MARDRRARPAVAHRRQLKGLGLYGDAHGRLPTLGHDPARIEASRLRTLQPCIIRGDSGEPHLSDEAFPFGEFISDKKGKVGSYSAP